MPYIHRSIENLLLETRVQRPAVYLTGPRQAGKSTLVQHLATHSDIATQYLTMDNYSTKTNASTDPLGFLRSLKGRVILDEIQLAPELFRPLKQVIDEQRNLENRTTFLLTGPVNVLSLPALSDALVGRMSVLTLYPLSVAEAYEMQPLTISHWFDQPFLYEENIPQIPITDLIDHATFPELIAHPTINRYQWFEDYLTTLLYRDIRSLSEIEKSFEIPKMLRLLASRAGNLINDSSTACDLGLSLSTYRRYRSLLERVFLIKLLPPWFTNKGKRLVKSPKLFFLDTALLCHALAIDTTIATTNPFYGRILENLVATELLKLINSQPFHLYHFRTQTQQEVDFVLERHDSKILGIEVKPKAKISTSDLRGLLALKEIAGEKFCKGIILYQGSETYSLGHDCYAVPLYKAINMGGNAI